VKNHANPTSDQWHVIHVTHGFIQNAIGHPEVHHPKHQLGLLYLWPAKLLINTV